MSALSCASSSSFPRWRGPTASTARRRHFRRLFGPPTSSNPCFFPLHVIDESKEVETSDFKIERSESDKLVDSLNFGELCDDFECISSPAVESTARQLARDILELREGNRALGSFSISVKYKDPLRSFVGREKYKRPLWATIAVENPKVTVQEMVMLSTSELNIKWTLRGRPKNPVFSNIGGDLTLRVDSKFILNQISGQVIEHMETWDLSASTVVSQVYFWSSRRFFSAIESGKDTIDAVKSTTARLSAKKENMEIYPDPSGDPTKFFQRDDGLQRDTYQIALFLAVIYFVVQFLRTTL
ncbi:uncharacterized protein [Typha latifolia]|uniref:uncharacterized protein n=1 Tax=Typha latifolia TaxID=4733 RepID=UPI003C2E8955